MKIYFKRLLNRFKNKLFFKFRKKISPYSKEIYAICLMGIYHKNNDMRCDLATGDIIIKLKDLGYHIIITYSDVIITNHEFPNLGQLEDKVVDKIRAKAIAEISKDRQQTKNEILLNYSNLIKNVKDKVRNSSRNATLKKMTHEHTNF